MFRRKTLATTIISLSAARPSGTAQAQLEEVIVTATKREQTLQDVPVAVTVTSAETLERALVEQRRQIGGSGPRPLAAAHCGASPNEATIVFTIVILAVAVLAVLWALTRLRRDEGAERRLQRAEYEPLVKHIWYH